MEKADGEIGPLLGARFGILHAYPGLTTQGVLSFELLPGRDYVLECAFKDTDTSPEHYKLGMIGGIHVAAAP